MNTVPDEHHSDEPDNLDANLPANAEAVTEGPEKAEDESEKPAPRQSMRDRANAPSDTVGTGSYAAITCSVLALMTTALLIAGLLLSRWLF